MLKTTRFTRFWGSFKAIRPLFKNQHGITKPCYPLTFYNTKGSAQPAHAADRFAREIGGFLTLFVARLRRLMGKPLDGSPSHRSHPLTVPWYTELGG
jgi:hypothetical protein